MFTGNQDKATVSRETLEWQQIIADFDRLQTDIRAGLEARPHDEANDRIRMYFEKGLNKLDVELFARLRRSAYKDITGIMPG